MSATKRVWLFSMALGLNSALLFAQTPTPAEMDLKQAQLNEQMGKLDEIERAHGTFVSIRDQKIAGPTGLQRQLKTWFSRTNTWLNQWAPIIESMSGDSLANPYAMDAIANQISNQYQQLQAIEAELDGLQGQADTIEKLLGEVRTFPETYIKDYGTQLAAFNQQVAALRGTVRDSLAQARAGHTERLKKVADRMKQAVKVRATSLALRFPELESKVREIEVSLLAVVTVDKYLNDMVQIENLVVRSFDTGRFYKAIDLLQQLQDKSELAKKQINQDVSIPAEVKRLGVSRIDALVSTRQEIMRQQFNSSSAASRFAINYNREVLDQPSGLFARCSATPQPKNLDCLLLKSILVQADKIELLTDAQLRVMETILDRVKEGPVHAATL